MKHFNVRVYGLWLDRGQVLVSEELIRGQKIIKFPGGGLEWGEGTLDGLKREWQEEMGQAIHVKAHFYTTDFFQPSAWDQSQVISIYYLVAPVNALSLPYHNGQEHFYFLPLTEDLPGLLSLPIDKVVAHQLVQAT
ncbi:NUDIX domain-containing protein [Taibaiella koreensis]|uniref:NUDIX domain-containing protein n=1 Tax=Taibaiella koreensis TaxID=1268548 RepID=UPI000E59CB34|nr:NUDIX domain-containing protein [Taibaiella koreensis]